MTALHCGGESFSENSRQDEGKIYLRARVNGAESRFTRGVRTQDGTWMYLSGWNETRGITLRFPKAAVSRVYPLAFERTTLFYGEYTVAPGALAGPGAVLEPRRLISSDGCTSPSGQIQVGNSEMRGERIILSGTFSGAVCDANSQSTLDQGFFSVEYVNTNP